MCPVSGPAASCTAGDGHRGSLSGLADELDARRVVIGFKLPRESEKPLLAHPETKAVCKVLLTKILGREVEVYLQDASSMKGKSDEWTERVARLFEGRVEDGA